MNLGIEKKYWKISEKYIKRLQFVPFVRMVAVCNNLAFGTVDEKSDIDLFIIAKKRRLFFVRSMVTFLLHIWGVRRHGDKIAARFCLSFFVDEDALDLSKIAIYKDIYLAFWIKSMIPLIDDGISNEFLKKNLWAKDFFERREDFQIDNSKVLKLTGFNKFANKFLKWILNGRIGNLVEFLLKKWQLKRARGKIKNVDGNASLIVEDHILKFHNIDRRREYRDKWELKYGIEKITDERFLRL